MNLYFSACLLLSSSLLMLVQPMAARMLLPHLGGSPGVWNACMVFFQTGLLAGYAYAHLGPKWLGVRTHAVVHALAMAGAILLLPIAIAEPTAPPSQPALWTMQTLAVALAVPYVLLAGASSLAQVWFERTTRNDPYFLYAVSNIGSLIGLFAYPLLLEPYLTRSDQAILWRNGFAVLTILLGGAAFIVAIRSPATANVRAPIAILPLARSQIARWIVLALAPSSLLLSITNHITTDLASVPLLWVIPLVLYLLTFAIVFARRPIVSHAVIARYVPIVILFLLFFWFSEATSPLVVIVAAHLVGFTWLALFCHGELAASRPPAAQLTAFYFWLALGGVLGGVCNVLLAPLLFNGALEYPLMIVVIGALRTFPTNDNDGRFKSLATPLLIGVGCLAFVALGRAMGVPNGPTFLIVIVIPLLATLFVQRPLPYALALSLIIATSAIYPSVHGQLVERRRSFFGVHRVTRDDDLIKLIHGNTIHGLQSLTKPDQPLAYYHRGSPIAAVIERMNETGRLHNVGVVGLGGGALAAYAQMGQTWTFFEIDPDVKSLAERHFTYLANSQGHIRIVLGDARLSLAQSTETFDLLIIDAFGSDSIPTHLLTREALAIYAAHLKPGGVVAFHVSNRYLDLFPILAAANTDGWHAWRSDPLGWPSSPDQEKSGRLTSWWGLLARHPADATAIVDKRGWLPLTPTPGFRPWTDDFINLPAVIRWDDLLSEK